ncbi:MAG: hypothetical protein A2Y00_07030 [Omnitrophica WOR_2 bacterium GWF2_43_52]|nr:MAG: hypothetical protein A2Y00_07030 [Omnitrophica WOR_2 bacterium GWF2_43_52]OGX55742.1 MAG: hypothetical protein A2460_09135 [Omnitrophica WOR_2 bacterium RIFOXYC2_FULL_43_9]
MGKTALRDIYLLNEFTDICNLKCIMCDHGRGKKIHGEYPLGILPDEQFQRILNHIKYQGVHIKCFHAGWLGEPLCHPASSILLAQLFRENALYNYFDGFSMNTNGILLHKEISNVFLDYAQFLEEKKSGFVRIHMSLHAATKKIYETITGKQGENIGKVLDNIDYLMAERKKRNLQLPNLTFLFVVTESNKDEAKAFLRFWQKKLKEYNRKFEIIFDWPKDAPGIDTDAIYFRREIAYEQYKAEQLHKQVACRLGLIPKPMMKERIIKSNEVLRKTVEENYNYQRRPCPALFRTLVVHNTGIAVPCCSDLRLELKVGDLTKQSLDVIWHGEAITEMRLAHIRGDFAKYNRCCYCNNIDSFVISDDEIVQYLDDIGRKDEIMPFLRRMRKMEAVLPLRLRERLNICLVSREYPQETGWGGIGTYTYQLATGLEKKGHTVHVVALSLNGNKEYTQDHIYVHRIAASGLFCFKGFFPEFLTRLEYSYHLYKTLQQLIRKYSIDIVEAPNFFAEAFIYSLFGNVPLVIRLHSSFKEIIKAYGWPFTLDRKLSCFMEDSAIIRSDLITCSTKICAQSMAEEAGIDVRRIAVIPLGVMLPDIQEERLGDNYEDDETLRVLFVGRLERRKGVHILMQAIPRILEEMPHAHFTFIGRDTFINAKNSAFTGSKKESFREFLLKDFPQRMKGNLHFLGFAEEAELRHYLRNCHFLVAPSLYETFGFIYIEAMSYGKPVIGCKVGGVSEVIIDQKTGIVVPPADSNALAQAIAYLLKNKQVRVKMGQAAFEHVKNNFICDTMIERTLNAYKEVLRRK